MKMEKSSERDLFIKYLAQIYIQNPDIPISKDTIYHELYSFNVHNGKQEKLKNTSLINVQIALSDKYKDDERTVKYTSRGGCFWIIEGRNNLRDYEFYDKLFKAIKLYISVDSKDIHRIAQELFDFALDEKILYQAKVAKVMRNDALVMRVSSKEEAIKVCDFVNNKLQYDSRVKPNPFIFDNGKVSIAIDGKLSYNETLCKFLTSYLNDKRNDNDLSNVSEKDFLAFISTEMDLFKNGDNKDFVYKYGLNSSKKIFDFVVVANLLMGNMNDTLNMKNIFSYQKIGEDDKDLDANIKRANLLYVMNVLSNKYGTKEMHSRINKYLDTGDSDIFTREGNARRIMYENFNKESLTNLLLELGYSALVEASIRTVEKYGEGQLYYAVNKLLCFHQIDGFTNTNDARSYLGFISNERIIYKVLMDKLEKDGKKVNAQSVTNLLLEEVNKNIEMTGKQVK